MNVLVLTNTATPITAILEEYGESVIVFSDPINISILVDNGIEFIVSHNYCYIIKRDVIDFMKDRIINLHISLLPWNRGADPNLWSFLEDTPKGVTIHLIDYGIDTGDIIVQKEVIFENENETLSTTYSKLQYVIVSLFKEIWPFIKTGKYNRTKQPPGGSFHKTIDKAKYEYLLTKGWDTPIKNIIGVAKNERQIKEHTE